MTPEQKSITDWMRKAGQDKPIYPTVPPLAVRQLRARLIYEEAMETIAYGLGVYCADPHDDCVDWQPLVAFGPHLVELADGIADLMVVAIGTASAFGIDMEPIFAEVMRSNNSKWWTAEEVKNLPIGYTAREVGEGRYCVKDEGGKVKLVLIQEAE